MTSGEQAKFSGIVAEIKHQTERLEAIDEKLCKLVDAHPYLRNMAVVVGPACAAAIGSHVGSPLDFPSPSAFEKAMGLNLKERSSGEKKGQLGITKRGSPQVRQLLYMAALRMLQRDPIVATWYRGRRIYKSNHKVGAVVAVMRKLARALWHIARGETFDAKKLFDVRRLDLTTTAIIDVPEPPSARESYPSPQQPFRRGGAAEATA